MTSWAAGGEGPALGTGDHQVPPWGVGAPAASEMGLPCVGLPWTSESQQKVNSCWAGFGFPPRGRFCCQAEAAAPHRQISQVQCFSLQRKEHSGPDCSSSLERSILPSIK